MKYALLLAAILVSTSAYGGEATFDCLAEPAQRVQIGSPVTGLLASVDVGRGTLVTAGQTLARLDSRLEEANLALAQAQAEATEALQAQKTRLALAESSLERSLKLEKSGTVTQSRLEELHAAVEIGKRDLDTEQRKLRLAALEVERQKALLARQVIQSPINGMVFQQSLRVGEFVRQDSPIMTIVQTDPLYVEAYVPIALWGKIVKDTRGLVTVEQPVGTRREALVTVVDRVFDAASGTFGVRLELANTDNLIPAGQRCRLTFDIKDETVAQPQ